MRPSNSRLWLLPCGDNHQTSIIINEINYKINNNPLVKQLRDDLEVSINSTNQYAQTLQQENQNMINTVSNDPVTSAPAMSAPVTSAPVMSAPVTSAPAMSTPSATSTTSNPAATCMVAYYHCKEEVLQITQRDGSVLYEYSNGQVERHCADGVKIVLFPDGTKTML